MKMEQTECSETSAYKIQTPGNYPNKTYNIQNTAKVWNKKNKSIFRSQDVAVKSRYIASNIRVTSNCWL